MATKRKHQSAPPPLWQWNTVAQVAAHVQTGPKTIYRAIKKGRLRAARIGARGDLRVHETWVREWLERLATPAEVVRRVG